MRSRPPEISAEDAILLGEKHFGFRGKARELPSYLDGNWLLEAASGERAVLKIANVDEDPELLDLQNAALAHLAKRDPGVRVPQVLPDLDGKTLATTTTAQGEHGLRLVRWIDGAIMADHAPYSTALLASLGRTLARVDRAFADFEHPRDGRGFRWDLARIEWIAGESTAVADEAKRALLEEQTLQVLATLVPRLEVLPRCFIHNDANEHNVLVSAAGDEVVGLFDFGDAVRSPRVFEPAVALTYALFGVDDPDAAAAALIGAYHAETPLGRAEIEVVWPAVIARLCLSLTVSSKDAAIDPDNEYLRISQEPAWRMLARLRQTDIGAATAAVLDACGFERRTTSVRSKDAIREERGSRLGGSLSLSYRRPLHIVRGLGAYLYEPDGRAYLDGVNNVCHVGHCHPHVVDAAQRQIAELNTNTRYLHEGILDYARRLTATLPDRLDVCFFVNSGSEANELALRMARTATGSRGVVVLEGAYHGNTSTLIDISPYKHARAGGGGAPDWVHVAPLPDTWRGRYRDLPDAAERYANDVGGHARAAAASADGLAAFIVESIPGCGGQLVLPEGYLAQAFAHVRDAGGLCIADEVQVGFGRVGTHMWAFETQGVIPDIVTLGKPIGNGHPMAAVVTTRTIAEAFDNGMEFFSTFGGNPVSCAIGTAVLDVIDSERLRERAHEVGTILLEGLAELARRFPVIGQVRGLGLFLGAEFVTDHETRAPAPAPLAEVVDRMREHGFLLSIDGPDENVLKIKPPLAISAADARLMLAALERVLASSAAARV